MSIEYAVPKEDIEELERARKVLWKYIGDDLSRMLEIEHVTTCIFRITHRKYNIVTQSMDQK